jgi:hypothetical protein
MRKLCALALLMLLVLLALSCSPPPFNLGITQAAITASRMTLVGEVGPIQNIGTDQGNSTLVFYPEKDPVAGFTLQAGFVSWASQGSSQQIAFVVSDGSGCRVVAGSQGLGPNDLAPPFPGFIIQSLKNGHTGVAFSWDGAMASSFKYVQMTGDPAGNTFTLPAWTDLSGFLSGFITGSPYIRDASISPSPNPGYDYAYMLVRDVGTAPNPFQEMRFHLSQTGLTVPVALRSAELDLVGAIPTLPRHALYYYDPATTMGFANWYDSPSSSWMCWKWYESSPGVPSATQLPGITHRIDALLSTGELFSTEGDVGRLYDQNGNQLAQFTLTGLAFVEETYGGGVAQMIFSQALWYNRNLHFNVYSIPTTKLKSLGQ